MRLGIGAPQGLWGQAWEATEPHSTSWGGGTAPYALRDLGAEKDPVLIFETAL